MVSPGDIRKAAMKKRNRKRQRGRQGKPYNKSPLERLHKSRRVAY
jgi:hypothetical protein